MAIESSTFGISSVVEKLENYDTRLQTIILNIHFYLFTISNSWFYIAVRKNYYHKCNKSWALISEAFEKFLENPRNNYSTFMLVLEQEIDKFPHYSGYYKQLRALSDYISMGPNIFKV